MIDIEKALSPRLLAAMLVIAGGGPLAISSYAQGVQGDEPCVLCLYQRIPFALVIVLGIAGLLHPANARAVGYISALVFAAGMSVAIYHVGVEQHWWASAASCGDAREEVAHKALSLRPVHSRGFTWPSVASPGDGIEEVAHKKLSLLPVVSRGFPWLPVASPSAWVYEVEPNQLSWLPVASRCFPWPPVASPSASVCLLYPSPSPRRYA